MPGDGSRSWRSLAGIASSLPSRPDDHLVQDFQLKVHQVIARIEPGEVVTYGQVARLAGSPGAARAVGRVLALSSGLPWWRVVTGTGRLVPGREQQQTSLLLAEGLTPEAAAGGRALARSLGITGGGPRAVSHLPKSAQRLRARTRRP